LLKGDIVLKSKPGEGSEFIVSIPVTKVAVKGKKENPQPEIEPENVNLSGKKALVADDENSQLALTSELVKSIGFSCETSVNGKQALQKLKADQFDLVLTDIQMPIMDGFDLIKAIRNDLQIKDIPVIALSGRREIPSETYREAGFNKNLLKPYHPADLLRTIAEIFRVEIQEKKHKKQQQKSVTTAYDLEEIYLFSGGDDEAMEVILKAFLDSSKENVTALKDARIKKDRETMGKIAHKMLPMLKQMKAVHVIPALEKLERQQEVSDREITKTIKELKQLMKNLKTEVTA
jgi:CheY-like chemotaxis protein/HPt (histidine-containing phosphotransfer) domain-containing protein